MAKSKAGPQPVSKPKVYRLWRGNKIANEYTMSEKELMDKYFASEEYKFWDENSPYRLTYSFRMFVCSDLRGGIASSMDISDHFIFDDVVIQEWQRRFPRPPITVGRVTHLPKEAK